MNHARQIMRALLFPLLLAVLAVATTAMADSGVNSVVNGGVNSGGNNIDSPGGVVTRFLELVQRQRNYDRAADYIHWEEMYRRLGRQQQVLFTILQIGSADRLREVMLLGVKDPKRFVQNMTAELTQQLSFLAHSDGIISAQLEPLVEPYLEEVARAKARAEQLAFGPPQATVNGAQAVVRLAASERGKTSTVTIPLQNTRGRWLINPLDIVVRESTPAIHNPPAPNTDPLPRRASIDSPLS